MQHGAKTSAELSGDPEVLTSILFRVKATYTTGSVSVSCPVLAKLPPYKFHGNRVVRPNFNSCE